MIVKLVNAAFRKLKINDLGAATTPKITRAGKELPFDQNVTIADDEVTYASFQSGDLAKAIARGDVTVVDRGPLVTQRHIHTATATNLQTVFNLPGTLTYVPGNKSLDVYVEGLLVDKTGVYTETDNNTITFGTGLATGDSVQMIWYK